MRSILRSSRMSISNNSMVVTRNSRPDGSVKLRRLDRSGSRCGKMVKISTAVDIFSYSVVHPLCRTFCCSNLITNIYAVIVVSILSVQDFADRTTFLWSRQGDALVLLLV